MEFEGVFSHLPPVPSMSNGFNDDAQGEHGDLLSLQRVNEHLIMILIRNNDADLLYLRAQGIGKGNEAKRDRTQAGALSFSRKVEISYWDGTDSP